MCAINSSIKPVRGLSYALVRDGTVSDEESLGENKVAFCCWWYDLSRIPCVPYYSTGHCLIICFLTELRFSLRLTHGSHSAYLWSFSGGTSCEPQWAIRLLVCQTLPQSLACETDIVIVKSLFLRVNVTCHSLRKWRPLTSKHNKSMHNACNISLCKL